MAGTYLVMIFIEGMNKIDRLSSEMTGSRSCLYFVSFAHFVVRPSETIHHERLETNEIKQPVQRRLNGLFPKCPPAFDFPFSHLPLVISRFPPPVSQLATA